MPKYFYALSIMCWRSIKLNLNNFLYNIDDSSDAMQVAKSKNGSAQTNG